MELHLLAQGQSSKPGAYTPVPLPAQCKIMKAAKEDRAQHGGQCDRHPYRSEKMGQCNAKDPLLPKRERAEIHYPGELERVPVSILQPGVTIQNEKDQQCVEAVKRWIRQALFHPRKQDSLQAGKTEKDKSQQTSRQSMPQHDFPECGQPVSGKIPVPLETPLTGTRKTVQAYRTSSQTFGSPRRRISAAMSQSLSCPQTAISGCPSGPLILKLGTPQRPRPSIISS